MNYLGAKSELQHRPPNLSLASLAIEILIMVVIAGAMYLVV